MTDPKQPSESGEQKPAEAPADEGAPKLTPEEQMARYEEALKEEDWGHQPC